MATALPEKSALTQRWTSAVLALPILIGVCVWGATPFVLLCVALALLARSEITRAYKRQGIEPNGFLSLMGALTPLAALLSLPPFAPLAALLSSPHGLTIPGMPLPLLLFLACGLIAASIWETGAAARADAKHPIHTGRNLAYGLLCGAYVSLFSGVSLLRIFPWHGPLSPILPVSGGAALVLATMACAMSNDSAAFFVGRAAGRHKLAAGLSPHKTIEGLIGGIVSSIAVGAAAGYLLLDSIIFGLLIGAAAAALGPLGDLFKSALKREIGIKDFGSIIPGHGGILDRFDSLLFTCPAVVLLAKIFAPA